MGLGLLELLIHCGSIEGLDGMAPTRKRGAKGAKMNNELSLGDLVLAKVKGFPAWPAKVHS